MPSPQREDAFMLEKLLELTAEVRGLTEKLIALYKVCDKLARQIEGDGNGNPSLAERIREVQKNVGSLAARVDGLVKDLEDINSEDVSGRWKHKTTIVNSLLVIGGSLVTMLAAKLWEYLTQGAAP